jgi:two-component system chemotaxis response regulator CheB
MTQGPQSLGSIRVVLVDDSRVVKRALEQMLAREPGIEVVGTAADGAEGLRVIRQHDPDVVVLDVEMPGMGGIETVRALRKENKRIAIIMFSTLTDRGADVTLEALALGAADYALKPTASGDFGTAADQVKGELIARIRVHGSRRKQLARSASANDPAGVPVTARTAPAVPSAKPPPAPLLRLPAQRPAVLAIGCSTGGPNALVELFGHFPEPLPVPVVLVQHMPPIFTRMLAERLTRGSKCVAAEAEPGRVLEPGRVYVAPGGKHMVLARSGPNVTTRLTEDPPVNFCRPSVDPLFRSVSEIYGRAALALVLTGMGEDGLDGARAIQTAGGVVLAQDQESSVVWGMPGAVVKAKVAEAALPLEVLAQEVLRRTASQARRAA